jgi:hypothetical protein
MDRITEHKADVFGDLASSVDVDGSVLRISFGWTSGEGIRLRLEEGSGLGIELFEVLPGPFDLEPGTVERMSHGSPHV